MRQVGEGKPSEVMMLELRTLKRVSLPVNLEGQSLPERGES